MAEREHSSGRNYDPTFEIDLTKPEYAYMFGFFQADGHLSADTRNRGKFEIELSDRDAWILEQFAELIPQWSKLHGRTRDTNFKKSYTSAILTLHDRAHAGKRPPGMRRMASSQRWNASDDDVLRQNDDEDAARILGRSMYSVKYRRKRTGIYDD